MGIIIFITWLVFAWAYLSEWEKYQNDDED